MSDNASGNDLWMTPTDPAVATLANGTIIYLTTPLSAIDPYDEDRLIALPLGQKCVIAANHLRPGDQGESVREIEFSPLGIETMPLILDSFCLGRHGFPFSMTPVVHRHAPAQPEPIEADAPAM